MRIKAQIMKSEDIDRTLTRLAHQIIERNDGTEDLCLIGIHTRGIPLAKRLSEKIAKIESTPVPVGSLDITMYRDDLSRIDYDPIVSHTEIPFEIEEKTVVLVDDVIFTGRTVRAALEALMKLGRPARIQLCELIDRGHAELPVKADYVGKNIPTSLNEVIAVNLKETDECENVLILEK